ncbi:dynein light chain roadblock-type 1-like [Cololabis saira]|uniref:dynein light chain roadblock-type 1-like n=1 Tax=Cololabis saira TaxID=129043 RepID=UPI002AD57CEF|nr:dynein light chain roadblock-type 1-like [Cololabis saira]
MAESEVEVTLQRIQSQEGVEGVIVFSKDGIPIRSTLDNPSTVEYVGLVEQLVITAKKTVLELDPTSDLTFLRLRTKKNEIMVAPDKDYIMIVIQKFST